jgi:hypothetical protein
MYAIHAVLKTTVAAAVSVLKSVIRGMLLLTKKELISSVTVETPGDASALIRINSLINQFKSHPV